MRVGWVLWSALILYKEIIVAKYFKKSNGYIIEVNLDHDLASLKSRFVECDVNGKEITKPVKKATKKAKK